MPTARADISGWFDRGVKDGATHMLVVCDDFDNEDYPVYFTGTREGVLAKSGEYLAGKHSMQRVMEVYALTLPKEPQLEEPRSFNYGVAKAPGASKKTVKDKASSSALRKLRVQKVK